MVRFTTLLLLWSFSVKSYAQTSSPGGVNGETLWLKPSNNTDNFQYTDHSIYHQAVTVTNYLKYPKKTFLNFNPTFEFLSVKNSKDQLSILKKTNLERSIIIGVYQPSVENSDRDMVTVKKNNTNDFILSTGRIKVDELDYGTKQGQNLLDKKDKPAILTYYRLNQPVYSIWGRAEGTHQLQLSKTNDSSSSVNFKFGGLIPELITYNRMLSPGEQLSVESYLAVKYGVHLVGNYTRSDQMIIWSKENNATYHHHVAGIGKDDSSALLQPLSTSSYENPKGLLTIGRTLYQKDKACEDCVVYDLLNANHVILKDDQLIKDSYIGNNNSWGDVGGVLDVLVGDQEGVDFSFRAEKNKGAFLGLSSQEVDSNWQTADYGLKKESSNQLSWCRKGQCEDLNLVYQQQPVSIRVEENKIKLYIDQTLVKTEKVSSLLPLFVDFSLKEIGSTINGLKIHKKELGREFSDKEFYLWGDNDKEITKNTKSGISGLTTLNKVWKLQVNRDHQDKKPLFTRVEFDSNLLKNFLPSKKDILYYLVIDQKGEGKFDQANRLKLQPIKIIPSKHNPKLWAFETVWDEDLSGADAFTLGYSESFLATVKVEDPLCSFSKGKLLVDIISGKENLPISYNLYSGNKSVKEGLIDQAEEPTILDDVSPGDYTIKLTNVIKNVSQQTLTVKEGQNISLNLPTKVNLTSEGWIEVDASKGQTQSYTYEWISPSGVKTTGAIGRFNAAGTYQVKAFLPKFPTCSQTKEVMVTKSNIEKLESYPIPLKTVDFLTVKGALFEPETAKIAVYDAFNGFLIYSQERNIYSTSHTFRFRIPRTGVFRAVFITPSSSQTFGITVN